MSNRAKELLAMNKDILRTEIGLLTGHMTGYTYIIYLGLAEQKGCILCEEEGEDSIYILCPILFACTDPRATYFLNLRILNKDKMISGGTRVM